MLVDAIALTTGAQRRRVRTASRPRSQPETLVAAKSVPPVWSAIWRNVLGSDGKPDC